MPLSPVMSTHAAVGATSAMRLKTVCIAGLRPMIASGERSIVIGECRALTLPAVAAASRERPLRGVDGLGEIERLGEVVERAALDGLDGGVEVAVRGDDDDAGRRGDLAELRERRESVHAGQPHVEEDDVGRMLAGLREPVLRGGRDRDRVLLALERPPQGPGDRLLVVDDQDGGHGFVVGWDRTSLYLSGDAKRPTHGRSTARRLFRDCRDKKTTTPAFPTRSSDVIRTLALAMTALAAPVAVAAEPPKVEIVAHRGASFDAPENTVAAIKLAWEQKADAAEFDVFLSKDGKIVVLHDANTKRIAGVDKKVVDQTLRRAAQARRREVEGREVRRREDADAGGDARDRAGRASACSSK